MQRYTLSDFHRDFPDDKTCLEWLTTKRYPEGIFCKQCNRATKHHYIGSRKSYSCQVCGHHVHPTAGTIFHKSSTPLAVWFYAVYRIVQTHGTISVIELQHELGVTYKTAWRMYKLIRQQIENANDPLDDTSAL